ncbi:putative membrane protein [Microbacterium sp. W4I4]|uniref:HAAS signaling domain-containing protein n=1 Tax=Microbacterium sp. W4I4 TaxID=3042295 RepID=UPI00278663F8|nr:hypothetical protein [Microbacterium sp. W4I4]MDQ0615535.1 putative membrane protein [Microbacterium sp. W4I4]
MMTTTSDYLARLDVALRDVPHGVAAEIRAGIAEELSSLGPDAAEQRIAQLGDPAVIAREAMDAGGYVPPAAFAPAVVPAPVPLTRSRGFAIAAAIALSFGGFLVPFVGGLVGAVMVVMSGMWRTWEKVVAICAPLVLFGVVLLFSLPAYTTTAVEVHEASGTGTAPEAVNPLLPTVYDFGHVSILVLVVVAIPASGLWLLWRMRGRTAAL